MKLQILYEMIILMTIALLFISMISVFYIWLNNSIKKSIQSNAIPLSSNSLNGSIRPYSYFQISS